MFVCSSIIVAACDGKLKFNAKHRVRLKRHICQRCWKQVIHIGKVHISVTSSDIRTSPHLDPCSVCITWNSCFDNLLICDERWLWLNQMLLIIHQMKDTSDSKTMRYHFNELDVQNESYLLSATSKERSANFVIL